MRELRTHARSPHRFGRYALAGAGVCVFVSLASGQPSDEVKAPLNVVSDASAAALAAAVDTARAKKQALADESQSIGVETARARQNLVTEVRALYRITHPGVSPAAAGMSAVLRHVGRVQRLRRIVARSADDVRTLSHREAELSTEQSRAGQELDQAELRLAAYRAERRAALAAARSEDDDGHTHYGLRIVDGPTASNFENERGRLSSPVSGEVEIVAGRVAESEGPGIEFRAPAGTPVHAVAPGRVVFADRYGSYGQLVVLDHGQGYYTAYGGLRAITVSVGDDLPRLGHLGEIGTDFSPPAVLFEVRKGNHTLEPSTWLGY